MLPSATDHISDGRELSTAFYQGHDPAETPYTSHILPLTRSMPSVRHAVAALAACHLGNRLDDEQLRRQSLRLRIRATGLLREDLKNSSGRPELGRLVCMLLLAQLDVRVLQSTQRLSDTFRRCALETVSSSESIFKLPAAL